MLFFEGRDFFGRRGITFFIQFWRYTLLFFNKMSLNPSIQPLKSRKTKRCNIRALQLPPQTLYSQSKFCLKGFYEFLCISLHTNILSNCSSLTGPVSVVTLANRHAAAEHCGGQNLPDAADHRIHSACLFGAWESSSYKYCFSTHYRVYQ